MTIEPFRHGKDATKLTPREAQILALVREGKKHKEISEILGIKYNTVVSMLVKARDKEKYA